MSSPDSVQPKLWALQAQWASRLLVGLRALGAGGSPRSRAGREGPFPLQAARGTLVLKGRCKDHHVWGVRIVVVMRTPAGRPSLI